MAKKIRLDKILSHMGIGTRSEVKKIIKQKRVAIDGKITNVLNTQVMIEEQVITLDNVEIKYEEFFYFIINKPEGVISATKDNMHETVIDLLDLEDKNKEVFPVGRLDIDTEGLLLLTNDGKLSHELLSPKKNVPKTYFAKVDGKMTQEDVEAFKEGITLEDGYNCLPAHLHIISAGEISEIEITINEGKFHQVKRMVQAVGKQVFYLQRIQMGNLKLPEDLELGSYRKITQEEKDLLTMTANEQTNKLTNELINEASR
ncbi:MAG TPA: rRNA pseudouridine synthase [Epulopiscium sp.]|nr:rRNA pseudouridine synthase [Candidatus Epulonipiscium sp.]